jgi:Mg2+/Co2+ transporter CorB
LVLLNICFALLSISFWSRSSFVFFVATRHWWDRTRPCVKGKIIADLIDRPKKASATLLVANNFINIGVVILFSFIGKDIFCYHFTGVKIHCRSNPSYLLLCCLVKYYLKCMLVATTLSLQRWLLILLQFLINPVTNQRAYEGINSLLT